MRDRAAIMSNEGYRVFFHALQCVHSCGLDVGFDGPMLFMGGLECGGGMVVVDM